MTVLGIPLWVWIAAGGGLLLFILLLVIILLSRRRRRKRREAEEAELQASQVDDLLAAVGLSGQAGDANNGADVMEIQSEQSMQLRKDIRQFASENPEIAAQMVRNWLRGGDDDG